MDEEREEREGHRLPKSEDEQQDEQAEKDTEGHTSRIHRQDEGDDDEGEKGDKQGHMGWSDVRLKHAVGPIRNATARLSRLAG